MLTKLILVLVALITAGGVESIAINTGTRDNGCTRSLCPAITKYGYRPGTSYNFYYHVTTGASIKGSSDSASHLQLTAEVKIQVITTCDLVLKIENAQLHETDPRDDNILLLSPSSSDLDLALREHSLYFSFLDGVIDQLCPNRDENTWVLNIKRGILSTFQNRMNSFNRAETIQEIDVAGSCETKYKPGTPDGLNDVIWKTKNLLTCTERNGFISSIKGTTYKMPSVMQDLPLIRSELKCKQIINSAGILQVTNCQESHLFKPFSKGESGAMVESKQLLRLIREESLLSPDEQLLQEEWHMERSSLLFEHNSGARGETSKAEIQSKILDICQRTLSDIRPETPLLFTELVQLMRQSGSADLQNIYNDLTSGTLCTNNPKARKMFFDAIPLVGTAASLRMLIKFINEDQVTGIQAKAWLTSLSFLHNPTKPMIKEVLPLLERGPNNDALLPVTSLVHSYCQKHPCTGDTDVWNILSNLQRRIGYRCQIEEDNAESIILALRSLGNAGQPAGVMSTINACVRRGDSPRDIRLAAVEAFRRMPCNEDRSELWSTLLNINEDSELRIQAYLSIMACADASVMSSVRKMLESEVVKQVGSFIWSHLTNLMKTKSQYKQAIKNILQDTTLGSAFDLDFKKYSRNYEKSIFLDNYDAGGSLEGNLVWSPESHVPRSALLNLTVDMFGNTLNILEIGGRAEGLDAMLETYFGPNGYFGNKGNPSTNNEVSVGKYKKLLRLDRQFELPEKQLGGSLYIRMFGNELGYSRFGYEQSNMEMINMDIMQMFLNFLDDPNKSLTYNTEFLDSTVTFPTFVGFPFAVKLTGAAVIDLKTFGHFDLKSSRMSISGGIQPSGAIDVRCTMMLDATVTKLGLSLVSNVHSSTMLQGKVLMEKGKLLLAELDFPREKMEIFSFKNSVSKIRNNRRYTIGSDGHTSTKTVCTGDRVARLSGLDLCWEVEYPDILQGSNVQSVFLTAPTTFEVAIHKRDTHRGYMFKYNHVKSSSLHKLILLMDTPGSTVSRHIELNYLFHKQQKFLRLNVISPWKTASLLGSISETHNLKQYDAKLTVDSALVYGITASLGRERSGYWYSYLPKFEVKSETETYLKANAVLEYKDMANSVFDMEVTGSWTPHWRINGIHRFTQNEYKEQWMLNFDQSRTYSLLAKITKERNTFTPMFEFRVPNGVNINLNGVVTLEAWSYIDADVRISASHDSQPIVLIGISDEAESQKGLTFSVKLHLGSPGYQPRLKDEINILAVYNTNDHQTYSLSTDVSISRLNTYTVTSSFSVVVPHVIDWRISSSVTANDDTINCDLLVSGLSKETFGITGALAVGDEHKALTGTIYRDGAEYFSVIARVNKSDTLEGKPLKAPFNGKPLDVFFPYLKIRHMNQSVEINGAVELSFQRIVDANVTISGITPHDINGRLFLRSKRGEEQIHVIIDAGDHLKYALIAENVKNNRRGRSVRFLGRFMEQVIDLGASYECENWRDKTIKKPKDTLKVYALMGNPHIPNGSYYVLLQLIYDSRFLPTPLTLTPTVDLRLPNIENILITGDLVYLGNHNWTFDVVASGIYADPVRYHGDTHFYSSWHRLSCIGTFAVDDKDGYSFRYTIWEVNKTLHNSDTRLDQSLEIKLPSKRLVSWDSTTLIDWRKYGIDHIIFNSTIKGAMDEPIYYTGSWIYNGTNRIGYLFTIDGSLEMEDTFDHHFLFQYEWRRKGSFWNLQPQVFVRVHDDVIHLIGDIQENDGKMNSVWKFNRTGQRTVKVIGSFLHKRSDHIKAEFQVHGIKKPITFRGGFKRLENTTFQNNFLMHAQLKSAQLNAKLRSDFHGNSSALITKTSLLYHGSKIARNSVGLNGKVLFVPEPWAVQSGLDISILTMPENNLQIAVDMDRQTQMIKYLLGSDDSHNILLSREVTDIGTDDTVSIIVVTKLQSASKNIDIAITEKYVYGENVVKTNLIFHPGQIGTTSWKSNQALFAYLYDASKYNIESKLQVNERKHLDAKLLWKPLTLLDASVVVMSMYNKKYAIVTKFLNKPSISKAIKADIQLSNRDHIHLDTFLNTRLHRAAFAFTSSAIKHLKISIINARMQKGRFAPKITLTVGKGKKFVIQPVVSLRTTKNARLMVSTPYKKYKVLKAHLYQKTSRGKLENKLSLVLNKRRLLHGIMEVIKKPTTKIEIRTAAEGYKDFHLSFTHTSDSSNIKTKAVIHRGKFSFAQVSMHLTPNTLNAALKTRKRSVEVVASKSLIESDAVGSVNVTFDRKHRFGLDWEIPRLNRNIQTERSSFIIFRMPQRSIGLTGLIRNSESKAMHTAFHWDMHRDVNKKVTLMVKMVPTNTLTTVYMEFGYPVKEKELQLISDFKTPNDRDILDWTVKIRYSPSLSKQMTFRTQINDMSTELATNYSLALTASHPYTDLDFSMTTCVGYDNSKINAGLDANYLMSSKVRHIFGGYGEINFKDQTFLVSSPQWNGNSFVGELKTENPYSVTLRNPNDATYPVYTETIFNPDIPSLNIFMKTNSDGNNVHLRGLLLNSSYVYGELSRQENSIVKKETSVVFNLRTPLHLETSVHWNPTAGQDVLESLKGSLKTMVNRYHSNFKAFVEALSTELNDKYTALNQVVDTETREYRVLLNNAIRSLRKTQTTIDSLMRNIYEGNEFFVRDITEYLRKLTRFTEVVNRLEQNLISTYTHTHEACRLLSNNVVQCIGEARVSLNLASKALVNSYSNLIDLAQDMAVNTACYRMDESFVCDSTYFPSQVTLFRAMNHLDDLIQNWNDALSTVDEKLQFLKDAADDVHKAASETCAFWKLNEHVKLASQTLVRDSNSLLKYIKQFGTTVREFDTDNGIILVDNSLPLLINGLRQLPTGNHEDITLSEAAPLLASPINQYVTPTSVSAAISGRTITTFDGATYIANRACSYLLARITEGQRLTLIAHFSNDGDSLEVITPRRSISIGSNGKVKVDNNKIRLPFRYEDDDINILYIDGTVSVTGTHFLLRYQIVKKLYKLRLDGWVYRKTRGLLGNYDNEMYNDMMTNTGSVTDNFDAFLQSWELDKGCSDSSDSRFPFL